MGNAILPEPNEGDFTDFVLDGQQRLTSLFATLKGLKIEREVGKIEHYDEMFINLDAEEDEDDKELFINVKFSSKFAVLPFSVFKPGMSLSFSQTTILHSWVGNSGSS